MKLTPTLAVILGTMNRCRRTPAPDAQGPTSAMLGTATIHRLVKRNKPQATMEETLAELMRAPSATYCGSGLWYLTSEVTEGASFRI